MQYFWVVIFLILLLVLAILLFKKLHKDESVKGGAEKKAKKSAKAEKPAKKQKSESSEAVEPAHSEHSEHKEKHEKHSDVASYTEYDFSKHNPKFYDKKLGDVSHGLIMFSEDGSHVLMSKNKKGQWGFYRTHEEDNDGSGLKAAIRKMKEETEISVPDSVNVLGEVKEEREIEFEEHRLNKHVEHQKSLGLRPHWNKPEKVNKVNMFYVVKVPKSDPKPKEDRVVEWISTGEAIDKAKEMEGNQHHLLEDAMKVLGEGGAKRIKK
jgi:hypothetical protein